MNAPSRSEVIEKLNQLVQESASREEIATWGQKWAIIDNPPDMEKPVWEARQFLAGADLISTDRPYLYTNEDIEEELAKLLEAIS